MARANEWRIRIVAGGVSWPGAYRGQGRMVSGGVMVAVVAVVAMVARCADANRPGAGRAFRAPGALSSGRRVSRQRQRQLQRAAAGRGRASGSWCRAAGWWLVALGVGGAWRWVLSGSYGRELHLA